MGARPRARRSRPTKPCCRLAPPVSESVIANYQLHHQEAAMVVPVAHASPRLGGAQGTRSAPNLPDSPVADLVHVGSRLLCLTSLEMPRTTDSNLRSCTCISHSQPRK
ncbi:hypothetical protein ZWY2020_052052 [Hordeum vulgare]|nr:hypothetical protein ZWY2020_052052 [Hordeum vulgare]